LGRDYGAFEDLDPHQNGFGGALYCSQCIGIFLICMSVCVGLEYPDPEFFHLWILMQILCILKLLK
jgi:hypothetical protein